MYIILRVLHALIYRIERFPGNAQSAPGCMSPCATPPSEFSTLGLPIFDAVTSRKRLMIYMKYCTFTFPRRDGLMQIVSVIGRKVHHVHCQLLDLIDGEEISKPGASPKPRHRHVIPPSGETRGETSSDGNFGAMRLALREFQLHFGA